MVSLVKIVAILGCVFVVGVLPEAVLKDIPLWASPSSGHSTMESSPVVSEMAVQKAFVKNWQEVEQGALIIESTHPYGNAISPAVDTQVEFAITGLIARAKVQQTFINPSQDWINARYVFPLPEDAAVDHLLMRVGQRVIEGQIKPKKFAKKAFEQAKREGKKASLVEQKRANIFSNQIANVGPGERVVVTIEYQQTVQFDKGLFSLRFPMTVGPRYIPGKPIETKVNAQGWALNTDQVPDANEITPLVKAPDSLPNNISILAHLMPGFKLGEVKSEFHQITSQKSAQGSYRIKLAQDTIANRDFVLTWRASANNHPSSAMFTQAHNGQEYGLVMVVPPTLKAESSEKLHREVVFILDTSGSMAGNSISQAKQALMLAIDRLDSGDTFNLIEFNSYARKLWPTSQKAAGDNKLAAKNFVQSLQATGGTEILPALKLALENQKPAWANKESRVRQVLFLTDGSVGNEHQLMAYIEDNLQQSRLFTIGIGSAPNNYFMTEAANAGRGTFTYIGFVEQVSEKMKTLFAKLERPAMTQISVGLPEGAEFYPSAIPDLYDGQPLMLVFKSPKPVNQVSFKGVRTDRVWSQNLLAQGNHNAKGINVYWARQKLALLALDKRHSPAPENIDQQIQETALEHHLVSSMTSLIAVDITPVSSPETSVDRGVANHLPHGWQAQKVFGHLPQTGTSAWLHLLLGGFSLLLALCLRVLR